MGVTEGDAEGGVRGWGVGEEERRQGGKRGGKRK